MAIFGAVAGNPAGPHFVSGVHLLALVSAAVWVLALCLTLLGVESAPRPTS